MKRAAGVLVLWAWGLGCGGGASAKPAMSSPDQAPPGAPQVQPAGPEPDHILLAHILISFQGTKTAATRSRDAAAKLAQEVLARAQRGEDFNKMMRDLSDDPGDGVYGLANNHASPVGEEFERKKMVAAFGDVGFHLAPGAIGMAEYDPVKSPYGWHIIKRLK